MILKKPTLDEVNNIDMSPQYGMYNFFPEIENGEINYLEKKAGKEHYKLLGWISNQYNHTTLCEIGTCDGMGLLALTLNKNNKVISYDIKDYKQKHKMPFNGERKICDTIFNFYDEIKECPIIFYDARHDGETELNFLNGLIDNEWKGVIFFDDIHFNDAMKSFWLKIELHKEDWSDIGHYTGTGVVFFK
tara:strand:+ start:6936 stop:7505 length:570 start_codon:yes stop_codon:yes gene_type:complete